jgi:twinkle protein
MTVTEIVDLLKGRAEEIARYLLPNGRLVGREWEVGSIAGEPGRSCKVCVSGDKVGVWADYAAGQSGDLLDLWREVRGYGSNKETLAEVKKYLGIKEPRFERPPKKTYNRPVAPKDARKPAEGSPVMRYLIEERKLTPEAIAAYRLGEIDKVGPYPGWKTQRPARGPFIVFPYFRPGGELYGVKYLHLERKEGKKFTLVEPGCEPTCFGWHVIDPRSREITICEGEIDAVSLWIFGYSALSVPFGGGKGEKQQWVDSDWELLEAYETIYLCLDSDKEGQAATEELVQRLGIHRCKIVTLPRKDANQCLQDGVSKEEIDACFANARTVEPEELKRANHFTDDVIAAFYPAGGKLPGFDAPWQKVPFRFLRGELTLVTGINGHGKAVSTDTMIPTPSGWVTMGDIMVGDKVFDENGQPCRVVAKSELLINRPCYRITFSDGTEIVCDENHEWLTSTAQARQSWRNARKNNRLNARHLKQNGSDQTFKRTLPSVVTTKLIAKTIKVERGCWKNLANHSVDVAGAIKCKSKNFLIDPYVLGLWLGDGDSYGGGFTTADISLLDSFRASYTVTKRKGKYHHYGILGSQKHLRKIGVFRNKHIPNRYMRGSTEQRLSLLQGLMDTDGSVTPYGRCEFSSTNYRLAQGVYELVVSLGMQAQIIVGDAKLNGEMKGKKYRVTFTPHTLNVFRLPRKEQRLRLGDMRCRKRLLQRFIVRCDPVDTVPVQCIQVDSPSHLYLVTKSFIPTHNSQIWGEVALSGMAQGEKWCIASMEMHPKQTLYRMVRQATAKLTPDRATITACLEWMSDKVWLFHLVGTAKVDRMMEVFEYAFRRHGIKQFVVDSLMKCGIAEDDYKGQKAFVERLCDFAARTGVHVYLIAHPRKGDDESRPVGKLDVKGTGAISDLAFNSFVIWRNKAKETILKSCGNGEDVELPRGKTIEDIRKEPDTVLLIDKSRNVEGAEGKYFLWFDGPSLRYIEKQGIRPQPYFKTELMATEEEAPF